MPESAGGHNRPRPAAAAAAGFRPPWRPDRPGRTFARGRLRGFCFSFFFCFMSSYSVLLLLHSWSRWLVIVFGLIALYKAFTGWQANRPFTKADNGMGAAFVGSIHLQVLLGLGLYFGVSPWGLKAMQAGGAMADPTKRFFGVEHVAVMLLAAVVAQVGRSLSKRQTDDRRKHKKALIWFGVALLLVLIMIPWGIWNPYRPAFRGL